MECHCLAKMTWVIIKRNGLCFLSSTKQLSQASSGTSETQFVLLYYADASFFLWGGGISSYYVQICHAEEFLKLYFVYAHYNFILLYRKKLAYT